MASPHHSPRLSARSWLRGNSRIWTDGSTHAAGRGLVCYATVPSCTPPCRTCLFQDLESTTLPYGFRPQVTVPTMMKQSLWEASQGPGNPPSHDWPRLQDSGPVHSQWVCTKQADGSWLSWISPPVFQNPPKGSEGQRGNREGRWHARVPRCGIPAQGSKAAHPPWAASALPAGLAATLLLEFEMKRKEHQKLTKPRGAPLITCSLKHSVPCQASNPSSTYTYWQNHLGAVKKYNKHAN